jgi:peptide/nickel transport system substrate-binding protein
MNSKELKALLRRRFNIPKERPIRRTILSFTLAERTVFYFFVALFVLAGVSLLWQVSSAYLQEVPIEGGTLVEGVVGNPRFINPVLALSEADKNLSSLIYSGLVRLTPDGDVVNDAAESVSISADSLTYTVKISPSAAFHDGMPVTADDVVFTIQKISDPMIKSPRRGNWEGITVEKVDERTVAFSLKKAYAPFIYNLTIGILPRHIWKNVTADEFSFSQFNTLPVGSGPYKIGTVERNQGGIPDYYELIPFEQASDKSPYIHNLVFRFYPSESLLVEAYNDGSIESIGGISPERVSELDTKGAEIIHSPLPRVFAVFFNQSQSKPLLDKSVRQALNLAAPKSEIVENILGGYGVAIESPVPFLASTSAKTALASSTADRIAFAKEILGESGWKMNQETGVLEKKSSNGTIELSFSISTGDAEELRLVAEELVKSWGQLGAKVEILVYETGELNQSVIRPRRFDALLFGEVVGREADLYPFWHSSQRNDPGLNIALYANSRADRFLEEARSLSDRTEAMESYLSFDRELQKDIPAIFLYSPSFLYVVPEKVKSVSLGSLSVSQDRFLGIRDWYIETDRVWRIFLD